METNWKQRCDMLAIVLTERYGVAHTKTLFEEVKRRIEEDAKRIAFRKKGKEVRLN